jgi:hypothetical protein
MTMYLPNSELQPTGGEVAEFLDGPPMAEIRSAAGAVGRREGTTARLDAQTRMNITRRAEEYIVGLVENHHGAPEDVRSIVLELHDHHRSPSWARL